MDQEDEITESTGGNKPHHQTWRNTFRRGLLDRANEKRCVCVCVIKGVVKFHQSKEDNMMQNIPTTFKEMFQFNAAVMGFGKL